MRSHRSAWGLAEAILALGVLLPAPAGGVVANPTQGPPLSTAVPVEANLVPPVIVSLGADATVVLTGEAAVVTVVAVDPEGGPLTYAWRATGGTIGGEADADPDVVTWTAPATPGNHVVSVTVTDTDGSPVSASIAIEAVWARSGGSATAPGLAPARIGLDPAGNVYVSDPRAGRVVVFTPLRQVLRVIAVEGRPAGIAPAPGGTVWVGDSERGGVWLYDGRGQRGLPLGRGDGELQAPVSLALDGSTGRLYVADGPAGQVRIYGGDRQLAGVISTGGFPAGVAVDGPGGEVYVSDATTGQVRVYATSTGALLRTMGAFGRNPGQLTRAGGIALGSDGNVYVVDSYQASVSAFTRQGVFLATVAGYGTADGRLRVPLDVAASTTGRLHVTTGENARVETYELHGAGPLACPGDADCDGMPDAWESAHGFDPLDPRDAFLDADVDGLVNLNEHQLGTDPHRADTDLDGVTDHAEVVAGTDPLDPADNRPVAVAGADLVTHPARVVLDGSGSSDPNGDSLTFEWTQVAGPATADIHDGAPARPWVVLRSAGTYGFRLRASDGKVWSAPDDVAVEVVQLPPRADPGPSRSARPGEPVSLDGRFSSDANGDALGWSWTQSGGPQVALEGADGPRPAFTPAAAGVYEFDLVVSDGVASSAPATARVVVNAPGDHVPLAVAPPESRGMARAEIALDGSGSLDADGDALGYTWRQVDGPAARLITADAPTLVFVPPARGVYVFSLTVSDGAHRSLPAFSTVIVSDPGSRPPLAQAGFDRRVVLHDTVTLGCGWSHSPDGRPLSCEWTQLEGVTVSLAASGNNASFVPIAAGTYAFEVAVSDPDGPGTRDQVSVVVDGPGESVPVAVARAAGAQAIGQEVVLDGSDSHDPDPSTTFGYQWTQVGGPWVDLGNAADAQPSFTATRPGLYAFELRVDDGALRGPPARVEVAIGALANLPPVASAGGDLLVAPGQAARVDGSGSRDPEGASLTYRWEQVGGPLGAALLGADTAALSVTPVASGFTLRFRLAVSDGSLQGVVDEVNLHVVDEPLDLRTVGQSGASFALAGAGGRFEGLTVEVPPGAFAGPVELALGAITRPWYAAPDRVAFGAALFVGPEDEPLQGAIALRIPLSGDVLAARGVTADQVRVARFDHGSGTWKDVPEVAVDLAAGHVTCRTPRAGVLQVTVPAGWDAGPPPDGGGCSCRAGGPGSGGTWLLAAAAALLVLAFRRRRGGLPSLLLLLLLLAAIPARAADPPHDLSLLPQACDECHMVHNAPGLGLTNSAGNANVCKQCHTAAGRAGNLPFADADQASSTGTRSSHSWSGLANQGAAHGASVPTSREMAARLDRADPANPRLTCSACHDQHIQLDAPFDPAAPAYAGGDTGAGRHFQRIPNNTNQMCRDCHAAWDQLSASSYTGGTLSHPVRAPIPTDPVKGPLYHPVPLDVADHGTASGGGTTLLADSSKTWTAGAFTGAEVTFTAGPPAGLSRDITGNTGNTLSFGPLPAGRGVDATTRYEISGGAQVAVNAGKATAVSGTYLEDAGKSWGSLAGLWVRFRSGGNRNVLRQIVSSTATRIIWEGPLTWGAGELPAYEIDRDGNFTNNLILDDTGTPSFTTGNVQCMTCHALHYADSSSTTYDDLARQGDGTLLRRSNADAACGACHKVKNHDSVITKSIRYTFGLDSRCKTCHQSHRTPNVYLVKQAIQTPNSGTRAVDFRNTAGKADHSFATVTAPGNGVCEVCHTLTRNPDGSPRFRNTGESDGNRHFAGNCITCHTHLGGFGGGESQGNSGCSVCHDFDMVADDPARTARYHHVMEVDVDLTTTPGVTTYPTAAAPTPVTTDDDKSCVQCHADHNIFRPDLNAANTLGRGANLRSRILAAPTSTPPAAPGDAAPGYYTSTDFDAAYATGGICASCHATAQQKNTADQRSDGTTETPAISPASFGGSAHAYAVTGRIARGASAFSVRCTKCHNDDAARGYQDGTWTFSLHSSVDRSLRAPLGIASPADPLEEQFCYRCHSRPADATGGIRKSTGGRDYYNAATMTNGAEDVHAQMQKGVAGSPGTYPTPATTLYFKPGGEEMPSAPAPSDHLGMPGTSTVSASILYLKSARDESPSGQPLPDTYLLASGTYRGDTTYATGTLEAPGRKAMSPVAGTTYERVNQDTETGSNYYRVAQFVSPPVATGLTWSSGSSFTLYIRNREGSSYTNAMLRYSLHQWTAGDTLGASFRTVVQHATEIDTTEGNRTIAFTSNAPVTFAAGDKIVLEIEVFTNAASYPSDVRHWWGDATSNARLQMPSTVTFAYAPAAPGAWIGRAMSPAPPQVTYEIASAVSETVPAGTTSFRRVSFTSPPVHTATALPAAPWNVNIWDRESSTSANARVYYQLYRLNADGSAGPVIVPWTVHGTEMTTATAPGAQQAITTPAGAPVSLGVGDKIVLDLAVQTVSVTTAGNYQLTYFFGSGATSNLVLPASVTFAYSSGAVAASARHDVARYSGLHRASPSDETQAYLATHKHVECEDCHNPHAAGAARHTQGTNAVSPVLAGVAGAIPTFSTAANWTAPTYAAGTATREHEICFRCHSGANTSLSAWNSSWTDVGLEFSTGNQSYHPVAGALPATDPGTTSGSVRLVAAQLAGGWTPGQTMYCSDCHGNDAAAPAAQGPHGSAARWLLKGSNTMWPTQSNGTTLWTLGNSTTGAGTAAGLFCLNCHPSPRTTNRAHTVYDHNDRACVQCHIAIPHGGKVSRLIATTSAPAPYNHGGNTAAIGGFRRATSYTSYSEQGNCGPVTCGYGGHTSFAGAETW